MPRLKKTIANKTRKPSHARGGRKRSSANFVEPVRELLMRRVSREIDRRDWTQSQAAEFLGVTQPRISDLTRGLTENFTIDALVQWIGLLGMELQIDTKGGGSQASLSTGLDVGEETIPYYTKLIAVSPQNTDSYRRRAHAYHQRGQYDLAIGDYTRAMELSTNLQHLRINRAQSYICLGQFGAAFLDCDQLIAQKPDDETCAWAYITRAAAQQAQLDDSAALSDYAKAIELLPNFAAAYLQRGALYERINNYKAAIRDFSKVLELEASNIQAQQHLEHIRKKSGEHGDDE